MTQPYVVVVGGANIDIEGQSRGPLLARDSNPGRVRLSPGGVGRNMAHNAALLGLSVQLLTAFGQDAYARELQQSCQQWGIDISGAAVLPAERTSTYLFIAGPDGEMELAVSDMEIYEAFGPAQLRPQLAQLQGAAAVAMDTNLTAETLAWLAQMVEAPLFADPVSTAKAGKLLPVLGKLHTIKPNRLEAELLTGISITDGESLRQAAAVLLQTGIQRVFISLGPDGVLAADKTEMLCLPNFPARVKNATGGGDAFMAGLLWAYVQGLSLRESARAGLAASSLAVEGAQTINEAISPAALLARLAQNP